MRFAVLALVALVGCGNKSKLEVGRGGDVDALWDLAPDGTQLGFVASPRAVDLGFKAIATARELVKEPDFAPAKPQLDALAQAMFGSDTATPEEAGFAKDHAFALFVANDGALAVMPVGDRQKFMTAKHGKVGPTEDTLENNTCRTVGTHYVCASKPELFARLGKGSLRGKLALAGARGDAELYMKDVPLAGEHKGDIAIAAQLEPGQVDIHGKWSGQPDGLLQNIVGMTAPHPDTKGASGFVALNLAPLLQSAPAVPLAGGVTFDQLAKSLVGPLTAVIPSGTVDIQLSAPLSDPKPAQTVIDNCKDLGQFFKLADKQTPGACRIIMQGTNALELDVWVDGTTLRVGAHKGPVPAGKPGGMTPFGTELANGQWTAAFWGRGTMLNLTTITPTQQEVPNEVALGIHAMSLVNEAGLGLHVDKDGVQFRAIVRMPWTNPPALADKIVKFTGSDIVTGKATEPAKALAASAPGSPFAADFAAGQGGLMIPAAMIGLASSIVVPAIARMLGGGGAGAEAPAESPTGQPPMSQADVVGFLLRAYVEEAYPKWLADHPKEKCPKTLAEVAKYLGDDSGVPLDTDPWGNKLVMTCDAKGFVVTSNGPDGKPGTADDIHP